MIKALFFDIDGTLVSFHTHIIPQSTVDALQKAHDKGIKVFIATGRPLALINNMSPLEERGLIDGYVTMNGAYCFVEDDIIFSRSISHQTTLAIGKYAKDKNIPCIFVPAHGIRVCKSNKLVEKIFYEQLHVDKMPETSFEEGWEGDIYQITPFFNQSQENEIMKDINDAIGNRWHPDFTDITAIGCDKSNGVKFMGEHFGYGKEEIMCFGDGGNDIPMIEYAGIGVALGNASDEVKGHADYITSSVDNDGIAYALKHYHLI
jgi:Cof subfamily protein (haloacid dehalogenase superfamily)